VPERFFRFFDFVVTVPGQALRRFAGRQALGGLNAQGLQGVLDRLSGVTVGILLHVIA